MANESSGEYITKKLEPKIPKAKEGDGTFSPKPVAYLFYPLGRINFSEGNRAEIQKNDLNLNLHYSNLNLESDKLAIQAAERFSDTAPGFKKIDDFQLTDSQGHKLELADFIPDGWTFIFHPDKVLIGGQANPYTKTLILEGNPTQPAAILTALHEGGHAYKFVGKDIETIKEDMKRYNEVDNRQVPPSLDDIAYHLRDERSAWAYTVRKILPFCQDANKPLTKEAVLEYVHERLRNPSERIRKLEKYPGFKF